MTGAGLVGKLPAKGDFVARNLSQGFQARFEAYIAATVEDARAVLAEDWAEVYDTAPVWRFWIGPACGIPACAGVIAASRDRVGRRYPLAILFEGGADGAGLPPPPLLDALPDWYVLIEAAMARACDPDLAVDPGEVIAALNAPSDRYAAGAAGQDAQVFWALGPMPIAALQAVRAPVAVADAPAAAPVAMAETAGAPDPWVPTFEAEGADGSPFDASGKFVAPVTSIEDASPFDDPAGARPNAPNFGTGAFAEPVDDIADETAGTEAEAADATPQGDDPETGDAAEMGEPAPADDARALDDDTPPDETHEPEPHTDTAAPERPDPDQLAEVLTRAARTEAHIHAAARSYWWTAGDAFSPPAVVAFAGLPDGAAFAAMLGGLRSAALANSDE